MSVPVAFTPESGIISPRGIAALVPSKNGSPYVSARYAGTITEASLHPISRLTIALIGIVLSVSLAVVLEYETWIYWKERIRGYISCLTRAFEQLKDIVAGDPVSINTLPGIATSTSA